MLWIALIITLVLCLIAMAFPEKKDTMYGCIVTMWKCIMWFFIIVLVLSFIIGFIIAVASS